MKKKLLVTLFCINLAGFTVGSGVGALLPVNAARLGANPDQIGLFMSAIFIGLACGMLVAGRFANRHRVRRPLLITAGVLMAILYWFVSLAVNLGQLALFTVAATFLGGVQLALINTIVGLHASQAERGKVFGFIASANSLGALLSGLAGVVVIRWGFSGLYTTASLISLLMPLSALFIKDEVVEPVHQTIKDHLPRSAHFSRAFWLLFAASVFAFTAGGIFGLARPLGMTKWGFNAAEISSTVAVGGLITLPFPLLLGWLSDRIGRRPLIALCYAAGAGSLFILAVSTHLWHFWVSSVLQAVMGASMSIGVALVTDLVSVEMLGSGLSLFGATNWIGLIVGSALTGVALQNLGFTPTLLFGSLLTFLAVCLVLPIRLTAFKEAVHTSA